MKIWGIGDFHLSFLSNKPMSIFGENWSKHHEKIFINCCNLIKDDDILIIPGDISWALRLDEAKKDLEWISRLPGLKIITKGNHDFWWTSISKVRDMLPEKIIALQNDVYDLKDVIIASCRGWSLPGSLNFTKQDNKVYKRELLRLRISLNTAKKVNPNKPIIVSMHYPPISIREKYTEFSDILKEFKVLICIYGHLHGALAHENAIQGLINDVTYKLVSCDFLNFIPAKIFAIND